MRTNKRFMKPLTSDIQLYTAQLNRTPIVIFIGAEARWQRCDRGISELSVAVKGERYMRGVCTFKYAG